MKKTIIPVLALALVLGIAPRAYAYNSTQDFGSRLRKGFEGIAEFLGISTEELQTARDEGITTLSLVEEAGKTKEEFHSYMQQRAVERMRENGLSEEEINERLEVIKDRQSNCDGTPKGPTNFGREFGNRN